MLKNVFHKHNENRNENVTEQKIMDNILKTKIRRKNLIIALWKNKRLLSLSNQIFQSIMNLSYSKVFSNIQLI